MPPLIFSQHVSIFLGLNMKGEGSKQGLQPSQHIFEFNKRPHQRECRVSCYTFLINLKLFIKLILKGLLDVESFPAQINLICQTLYGCTLTFLSKSILKPLNTNLIYNDRDIGLLFSNIYWFVLSRLTGVGEKLYFYFK